MISLNIVLRSLSNDFPKGAFKNAIRYLTGASARTIDHNFLNKNDDQFTDWILFKAESNSELPEVLRMTVSNYRIERENGSDCIMPGRNMALAEYYGKPYSYTLKLLDRMIYPLTSEFFNGAPDIRMRRAFKVLYYPYTDLKWHGNSYPILGGRVKLEVAFDALLMILACISLDAGDFVQDIDDIVDRVFRPFLINTHEKRRSNKFRRFWFKYIKEKICSDYDLKVDDFFRMISIRDEDPGTAEKRYKRWASGKCEASETKFGELLQCLQRELGWTDLDLMKASNGYRFYSALELMNSAGLAFIYTLPDGENEFKVKEGFFDMFSERFKFWRLSLARNLME